MRRLRLGTRGSRLALAQAESVAALLRSRGVAVELVTIKTQGDTRPSDAPIGEGVFVKALEAALLVHDIDIAVHSAKDLPLEADPALGIAAFPERADARDALVISSGEATIAALPSGCVVGTDSPRRAAFLRAMRADVRVVPLHGNVDTRLRRLAAKEVDALILACAGLLRLGFADRIAERLAPTTMPPAPGQGALAVQARRNDAEALAALKPLDDVAVRRAVVAERALLRAVGGGCRAPTGAFATTNATQDLLLVAGTASPSGEQHRIVSVNANGLDARSIARAAIFAADELLRAVPQPARALLDPRPEPDGALGEILRVRGFRLISAPVFATRAVENGELQKARTSIGAYDWVVLTSKRGVTALLDDNGAPYAHNVRWAAVGPATAAALRARNLEVCAVPEAVGARGLPDAMAKHASLRDARILLARADAADPWLPQRLRELGAVVDDVVAYRTIEGGEHLRPSLCRALDEPDLEGIVFSSGSAVRGLVALAGDVLERVRRLAIFTVGPQTSAVARANGFVVAQEAKTASADGIADAVSRWNQERVATWVEAQLTPA